MEKPTEAQASGYPQTQNQAYAPAYSGQYQAPPAYQPQQHIVGSYEYPQYQPSVGVVTVAPAPQPMVMQEAQGPPPSSYLALSIFTTICCFFPLGIAAIVFSVKTRNAINTGNYDRAKSHSSNVKIFNIISIAIGILLWIIVVVAQLGWIVPLVIVLSLTRRN